MTIEQFEEIPYREREKLLTELAGAIYLLAGQKYGGEHLNIMPTGKVHGATVKRLLRRLGIASEVAVGYEGTTEFSRTTYGNVKRIKTKNGRQDIERLVSFFLNHHSVALPYYNRYMPHVRSASEVVYAYGNMRLSRL
jgi:hypothetical protein